MPSIKLSSFSLGCGGTLPNFHTEMPHRFGTILCSADRRSPRFRFRNTHAFPDVPKRIRSRTRQKKDSKLILTLSDSFRKVLSLRVLASSMRLAASGPEKPPQQREAILTMPYQPRR